MKIQKPGRAVGLARAPPEGIVRQGGWGKEGGRTDRR